MVRIVGISGSLRKRSFNSALLHAATELMPEGASLEIATIQGIPLYHGDEEAAQGLPPAVTVLKDVIAGADGVLLSTPEYNNGIPGVFKNAIDWASRPPADGGRVFAGRPFAVIGASPGNFGTILAQDAWLPVLRALGTKPWCGGRLMASRASGLFDEQGKLTDEATRDRLRDFLKGFVTFVRGTAG